MNLQLNDEQKLLRDSAVRWVAAQTAAGAQSGPTEISQRRERWSAMAEFGWLAMTLPAEHEGLGQTLGEACVLAEALGAGPLADPYLPAIVHAAELIATGGTPAQQARWLPAIASGALLVVPADIERGAATGAAPLQTRATRAGTGWRLDGHKSVVPCGDTADAWLVSARGDDGASLCFVVARGTPGVQVQSFESVDGAGACSLRLDAAAVDEQALLAGADATLLRRAYDRAGIAACAESVGAMQAMLTATVEYTRTRQQFGKPLAANQVLRHRMADMSVACDEARSMTIGAIQQFEQADARGDATARTLAASAVRAKVAAAARRVAEEAIQLHGGMGVTEELNMGRYLRRLLALDATYGGAESHLRRHATLRTAQRAGAAIELDNGQPEMAALSGFRDEVRAFLAEHLTADLVRAARLNTSVFSEADVALRWQRALYQRGWVAPGWPSEYGGTGWSLAQRWIFETECAVAGAPPLSPLGLRMAGPVIMRFGTPEQKAHYLPRILAGDDYWCQGYSEPGSGSDLASLKTRARREQDVYVINGSKIWTTHAHMANRMFALVRTGEGETRKQDGISFLLIDMATPGITVRPIRSASGDHEVNQVFFDEVRVPVSCRVGDEGQGWTIAKYLLEFERGGAISAGRLRAALDRIQRLVATDAGEGCAGLADPDVALAFSAVEIDIRALEMTELRVMSSLQVGQNPGSVSSLLKLRWSEIHQSITRLGLRLLGSDALVWESQRPMHLAPSGVVLDDVARPVVAGYLNARAYTIFGGTSEIQREIISRDVIG
ncbi:MAG: acyl-CoA dehydrogenase family protein [Burkholderiaceae bacterium]|nr:acyl-CoA dehydrogenase family protein [Burkholderiaceae bacterium]